MSETDASQETTSLPGQKIHVTGGDYEYDGWLIGWVYKRRSKAIRYVIEDVNGRLFIHNAKQLGKPEGWTP